MIFRVVSSKFTTKTTRIAYYFLKNFYEEWLTHHMFLGRKHDWKITDKYKIFELKQRALTHKSFKKNTWFVFNFSNKLCRKNFNWVNETKNKSLWCDCLNTEKYFLSSKSEVRVVIDVILQQKSKFKKSLLFLKHLKIFLKNFLINGIFA